ncbi:helix-turn-helix domain-containing protein [Streptacidiphilus sp. ASG 303]|uniref:PucR family transcriptional regulator n=1 Tax=Streptacidiphilus sp. ASG 303 TaxID=2896847 RepID=UPI001E5D9B3C|nr:helix-turn-helix domain-containing protein [Streptacidiphilus sp. ASG 303]MCD0484737.1 helix-turn-helix domain-containing protein [Streptacidiphilus sp. ASG 303]
MHREEAVLADEVTRRRGGPGQEAGAGGAGAGGAGAPEDPPPGTAAARAEHLLALQRLAAGPGGTRELLEWLARRSGRWTALLDAGGAVLHAAAGRGSPCGPPVAALAAEGARSMAARGAGAARVDRDGCTGWFAAAGTDAAGPVLAVVGTGPGGAGLPQLVADTARMVGLCRRVEEADRLVRRSREADARSREAVLHLLMAGDVPSASRIAATLLPRLPDPVRVWVVEGPAGRRGELAGDRLRGIGDRAWVVPCPVYARHLLVVAPAAVDPPAGGADAPPHGCAVGVSGVLPLRETAAGYAQAFHALAVARSAPGRCAAFDAQGEPAAFLGPAGAAWARRLLGPLTGYAPVRRTDPDAGELLATLSSWLDFGGGAVRHLKVHRNTLSARLRRLEDLLGLDLCSLPGQAAAHLALHLKAAAGPADAAAPGPTAPGPADAAAPGLDVLLATPAAAHWADVLLRPLTEGGTPSAAATVRTWLAHDARLAPTAAALGISAAAVRKRLVRAEVLLRRSLLHSPSARYDLWLADRASSLARSPGQHVRAPGGGPAGRVGVLPLARAGGGGAGRRGVRRGGVGGPGAPGAVLAR